MTIKPSSKLLDAIQARGGPMSEDALKMALIGSSSPDLLEEGFDNKGKKLKGKTVAVKALEFHNDGEIGMNGLPKIEWWATKNIMKKKVEIAAFVPNQDGSGGMAGQPMMFKSVKEGDIQPAALELTLESAQALVDALWAAGITPSQYSNQSAELKAVREHLADIKQVAFSFLDLKK